MFLLVAVITVMSLSPLSSSQFVAKKNFEGKYSKEIHDRLQQIRESHTSGNGRTVSLGHLPIHFKWTCSAEYVRVYDATSSQRRKRERRGSGANDLKSFCNTKRERDDSAICLTNEYPSVCVCVCGEKN